MAFSRRNLLVKRAKIEMTYSMPIDPKIRRSPSPVLPPPLPSSTSAKAAAKKTSSASLPRPNTFEREATAPPVLNDGEGDVADAIAQWGGAVDPIAGRARDAVSARDSLADDGRIIVGTQRDPARLAALEAAYAKLETPSYLSAAERPPAKKANGPAVTRELATVLSGARTAALTSDAERDPIAAGRFENLLAATASLPSVARKHLFDAVFVAGARSDSARVIAEVLGSSTWKGLNNTQKAQLAEVLSTANAEGVKNLGALLEASPSRLLETDTRGHTLLENLAGVGKQALNATLYGQTTSAEVLSSLLRDIANPNRIDQGTSDTCTVTSMQWELANTNPAEYTRLVAGIAGPSGTAKMQGGGTLRLVAAAGTGQARHERSISSTLFQTSAMDDGNGLDLFDPIREESIRADGTAYGGLLPAQTTRILGQLFGVKYSTNNLQFETESARALESLRGFDAAHHRNRPVLLDLDQGPTANHTVTLERIADAKVFFRDPYGELRSFPETSFAKVVFGIHRPLEPRS